MQFLRLDNDINGNPRYFIAETDMPQVKATRALVQKELGLVQYRGKKYGKGYVLQSYNLEADQKRIAKLTTCDCCGEQNGKHSDDACEPIRA